ncbi:MAG: gliding motility lipoprotein GldH [Flavobacteriaceae bacterium]|nr:gliding motility lipoprotein GldH [Flavobacteriaceae bacterium]
MQSKSQFIAVFLVFLFVSCDSNQVFDEYKSVSNQWQKDDIVEFKFAPTDTLISYNLFINLRNNNDYKFNNLFLIAEIDYPNGKSVVDTLEYKMAQPNGEFLGTGFTDVKENKLWYKEKFTFNESGIYHIKLQHAMRENGNIEGVDALEGVTDIGFRIENINE